MTVNIAQVDQVIATEIMERHTKLIKSSWKPFRIGQEIIYYSQRFGIALRRNEAYMRQLSFETNGE